VNLKNDNSNNGENLKSSIKLPQIIQAYRNFRNKSIYNKNKSFLFSTFNNSKGDQPSEFLTTYDNYLKTSTSVNNFTSPKTKASNTSLKPVIREVSEKPIKILKLVTINL
jgi:hypothetical protein